MNTKLRVVMLATDGSPSATNAARVAASLAQEAGAALHVAHIWQLTQASVGRMADAASWQYTFDLDEQVARDTLAGVVADLATVGVPVAEQHLRRGRPADEIPALANAIGADLIVVGSRGLGPVKRLLIGSTAEAVVHSAHRPVLVVRGAVADWPPRRVVVGDDASASAANAVALAATIGGLCEAAGILVHALPPLPEHLRLPAPLNQPGNAAGAADGDANAARTARCDDQPGGRRIEHPRDRRDRSVRCATGGACVDRRCRRNAARHRRGW
jgi:nucleotide-binding universal stress UspA family protein